MSSTREVCPLKEKSVLGGVEIGVGVCLVDGPGVFPVSCWSGLAPSLLVHTDWEVLGRLTPQDPSKSVFDCCCSP